MITRLRERRRRHTVEFCDRCASVCDDRCRSNRLRDRARAQTALLAR